MTSYTDVEINFMAMKLVNLLQGLRDDGQGHLLAESCRDYLGGISKDDFQRVVVRVVERGNNILWDSDGYYLGYDGDPGEMFVALFHMKEGVERYMDKILEASAKNKDTFPLVVSVIEDGTGKSMNQLESGSKRKWSNMIKGLLGPGN